MRSVQEDGSVETYIGIIDEIIYYNDDNGYAVAVLTTENDSISIKGIMPFINYGDQLKVVGELDDHAQYGMQLKVKYVEHVKPTDEASLYRYLASGVIKGIGEATAQLLIETFGKDVLDVIQYTPEKLLSISGIGPKKLEQIIESYREQYELRDFIIYFQNLNLSVANAMRIYRQLGYEAMQMVERNPYILAETVSGIGFKVADRIAEGMGIDRHSPYRIKAGIQYVLQQFASEGHTYMPLDMLAKRVAMTLQVVESDVAIIIRDAAMGGAVFLETQDEHQQQEMPDSAMAFHGVLSEGSSPAADHMIRVFLPAYYYAEQHVAEKLYQLVSEVQPLTLDNFDTFIERFERDKGIVLGDKQKQAIERAVASGVFTITGGPGTGKTTIINAVLEAYESQDKRIALMAPTGRAAKRMTEATRREAKTIHRVLEFQGEFEFARNETNPIEADVIIVDEISMVDIMLMYRLLDAISAGAHLILVGDADQLPSVGAGRVLDDILRSGLIPYIALDEIYRQADTSLITVNAHRINHGEMPVLNQKDKDFFFIGRSKPALILNELEALISTRLKDYYGLSPLEDIQVLAPMKNSPIGVTALNTMLQKILNPETKQKTQHQFGSMMLRDGDKVMQTKNNYNLEWTTADGEEGQGVFNGDIGFVQVIDLDARTVAVLFDGEREVIYDFPVVDELIHAYAITIHKSQGSEFRAVLMPMGFAPPMLMSRNILYTAITRARDLVILVGDKRAMGEMIKRDQELNRYSGLYDRLMRLKSISGNMIGGDDHGN
nr:ATP-dependent RecD-like DNA helicase [Fusibacter paucivorans]